MNDSATYYGEHQAEDAMSVLATWIGQNGKVKVVYHEGTAVDADIFKGIIRIPRLACASGITQEALMLLRGRVYHEAGHIDETKLTKPEYPDGALHEIWNALEDRRMESVESKKHLGCEVVFRWATNHYNQKIADKMLEGKTDAPLWEALVGMSFLVEGLQPKWTLSPKAQDYVSASYSEFAKVKQCKDAREALVLAKKIYELLKKVNEEWKKQQPPPPPPLPKQKPDKNQKPEKNQDQEDGESQEGGEPQEGEEGEGKEDQKPQSGGSKDFDDYENEKPGKEKGPKEEKTDKEKGKGEKEEKSDKGDEDSGSSDSEEGDEGEESESGEESEDGDEEGDASGKGKGDDGDETGDEEGEGDGDGTGENGDETDEADDKGGLAAGNGDQEIPAGDEPNDTDGPVVPGDSPYKPDDSGPKKGNDPRDLEDELDGISREQAQNEDLEEFFKNLPAIDKEYTSRRDLDRHSSPTTKEDDKTTYRQRLSQVSVTVSSMTRALEQALRSLSMCRKNPYLRAGNIDRNRLVAIAKNLSKEVFYRTQDGMKLDVAVAIIIDESGSMGNFYEVQLLAMAIGEALNSIGIPFEIIGATTAYCGFSYRMEPLNGFTRTNPIVYNHYKHFAEKWGSVRERIIYTGAHSHNVDGEVVEYAAFRLAQRKERRKVLFSLSDGEPCAGHGNDSEMCANLKRVCQRVRKHGIEVYGFGIGTDSPRTFYGKEWFIKLDSVEKMGADFVRSFVKIVTEGRVKV